MNVQVTHVVVHTPEQAREIVRQAMSIADDCDADSRAWDAVFREACRLLGQRHTVVTTDQPVPLPPALLGNLNRH